MMKAIAAVSKNGVIGRNGSIPWHLPEDLKFFKQTTQGGILLMGRKTFESIGKPLPGRETWVLTRNTSWSNEGVRRFGTIQECLDTAEGLGKTVWVCGGSAIYEAFLPHCQELYLTQLSQEVEGDTFFPEFEPLFSRRDVLEKTNLFTIFCYKKR